MGSRGINYDTGLLSAGTSTHEPFDPEIVHREMRIIHDDLHCTAVRITGGYPDRLDIAATHAADAGLEVWFCPFTNGLTQSELLELLADCAVRAERLRKRGGEVVMLTGSEVSLFTTGFFSGDTLEERLAVVSDPVRMRPLIPELRRRMRDFLRQAVDVVRARFGGPVSYASLPMEGVDWTIFDIIATDAGYRTRETARNFRDMIRAFVAQGRTLGKPTAITEFGCAAHRGAAEHPSSERSEIEWDADGKAIRPKREYIRDEGEQVRYIRELVDIFETEGVDSAFVYTFARYDLPYRAEPSLDLDRMSAGIVKVFEGQRGTNAPHDGRYPDMPWEPKAAFDALADWYATLKAGETNAPAFKPSNPPAF